MHGQKTLRCTLALLLILVCLVPTVQGTLRTAPAHAMNTLPDDVAPQLVLSSNQVVAGLTLSVQGSGFNGGALIELDLLSRRLPGVSLLVETIAADDKGGFSTTIVVPSFAPTGNYVLVARGTSNEGDARSVAQTSLTVLSDAAATDTATILAVLPSATVSSTGTPSASPTPSSVSTVSLPSTTATTTSTSSATATAGEVADTATATATSVSTSVDATATVTVDTSPSGNGITGPASATLETSFSQVTAGNAITLAGFGFSAKTTINLLLIVDPSAAPIPLASVRSGPSGRFQIHRLRIPFDLAGGSYVLRATAADGSTLAEILLTVVARHASISTDSTVFAILSAINVTGHGFAADESISFSLNAPDGSGAIVLGQARSNHSGDIDPTSLPIPFGVVSGQWLLQATGALSNLQASTAITVTAETSTLQIAPATAKPGDQVSVMATHFQPGESVTVDLITLSSSIRLGDGLADNSGTVTLPALVLPTTLPSGTLSLVATGLSSHLTAVRQFTVFSPTTSATVSPDTLMPGQQFTLEGVGFLPNETLSVELNATSLTPLSLGDIVADGSGAFTAVKITLPLFVPGGSFTVAIAGLESGRQTVAHFVVQPLPDTGSLLGVVPSGAAGVQSNQVSPGGLVQVAGSQFPPHARVVLQLVGTTGVSRRTSAVERLPVLVGTVTTLITVTASATGSIGPISLPLPPTLKAGSYSLQAVVHSSSVASTTIKVQPLRPALTLSTTKLRPGSTVTVRGAHFSAGEQVLLALNSTALATTPRTILADRTGGFVARFTAPSALLSGADVLTASGSHSRATVSVPVTVSITLATNWYFASNDTRAGRSTVLALLNPDARSALVQMTFLYQGAPIRTFSMHVPGHTHLLVNLALVAGIGRVFSTILNADRAIGAESAVTYAPHIVATTLGARAPATHWYLAEGYTGGSFREYLQVMNPNSSYATVDVRFLPFNGRPAKDVRFIVRPRATIQIDARRYMPLASIGSVVTADKGIIVGRLMRFGLGSQGAHEAIGSTAPATVWLFGQGETSTTRQTFLTIANLNQAAAASVTATFLDQHGQPIGIRTIFINPLRRGNIKLNDVLRQAQVSTVVTSNVPVVVERPQYSGPNNLDRAYSGSVLFGTNSGSNTWLFPDASTAPRDNARIYLFNPSLQAVQVLASFFTGSGRLVQQRFSVPVEAYMVLDLSQVRGLSAGPVGVTLVSTNNRVFIAEEASDNSDFHSISAGAGIP